MRTPAGIECPYFYGDYYRGRNHEECRLLIDTSPQQNWSRDLCFTCPVPGILQANACKNMVLHGSIHRPFLILKRQVKITAFCNKCQCEVPEPHIGCGECHILPPIFTGAPHEPDTTD